VYTANKATPAGQYRLTPWRLCLLTNTKSLKCRETVRDHPIRKKGPVPLAYLRGKTDNEGMDDAIAADIIKKLWMSSERVAATTWPDLRPCWALWSRLIAASVAQWPSRDLNLLGGRRARRSGHVRSGWQSPFQAVCEEADWTVGYPYGRSRRG
jgi:hypothetical protein